MISVGLELTDDALRVAVLDGGRAGVKLKAFESRKVDAKKGEVSHDIVGVLEEVLRATQAPKGAVVTAIRAQDCTIRELTVPFREDDKIRKTIKYQAESFFTTQSIDDLIIEFSKFAEAETKAKLLVAGVRKALVGRRLELLGEAGVDPLAIDLDVAALHNAYAHFGAFEGHGAVLLVDIDKDTLKVGVVEEGKLRLARAIRMRLGSMRLDAHRPSGVGRREAEDAAYDTAADESARLPVVILDDGDDEAFSLEDSGITETEREGILHRVFMEIDRTVAAIQLAHEVDLICLTGPSCRLDGIEQVFSEHFEIEARRFDLAGALGVEEKGGREAPSLTLEAPIAVGLALKGLGIDHSGMDFRQEEFVYRGMFGQLKRALACTVTLLFALAFLGAFSLKQELQERQGRLQSIKALQGDLYTVVFPSIQDPSSPHLPLRSGPGNYYQSMLTEMNALRARYGGGGPGDDGPHVSALEILRDFAQAKDAVKGWEIEVMKVAIDPRASGKSRFVCLTNDQPGAIELTKQFEQNEVLRGNAREIRFDKKSGKWTFEFLVEIRREDR